MATWQVSARKPTPTGAKSRAKGPVERTEDAGLPWTTREPGMDLIEVQEVPSTLRDVQKRRLDSAVAQEVDRDFFGIS